MIAQEYDRIGILYPEQTLSELKPLKKLTDETMSSKTDISDSQIKAQI